MTFVKIIIVVISIIYIINKFIPAKGVKQITIDELSNNVESNNKQLIDVRTRGEYRVDHIKGSINIPLRRLHKEIDELDKNKETVVICHTGIRSMQGCKKLQKLGFENLVNVQGGMIPKPTK